MCAKRTLNIALVLYIITMGAALGFGQALFTVGSSSSTAADIGNAEIAGPITLTVASGTTVNAPILISYSAPMTNNTGSEITVTGSGGLSTISGPTDFDFSTNSIVVEVPAGGAIGDTITISGVRIALAGSTLSQVTASVVGLSSTGNAFMAGQTNPVVIGQIARPFQVDETTEPPLAFSNGMATISSTTFKVTENYANAFAGSGPSEGRIRIVPFPVLPEGIRVTLGATVVSHETGAYFTTLSGESETIPREDGSTDVIYRFVPMIDSFDIIDSFPFTASLTVDSPESGYVKFQAELIPIGLAIPNTDFPSTAIPRYTSRLVPDEVELMSGITDLVFPFRIKSENTYTGIALTNPLNYRVSAVLTAYDANGQIITGDGITNPVEIELARNGQYAELVSAIFGTAFNQSTGGTIRVVGRTSTLQGFYLTGELFGHKLDGSVGNIAGALSWYLPVVLHGNNSPFNLLEVHNTGNAEATLNLHLIDANGVEKATAQELVAAGGMLSRDIRQIFSIDLSSFQGGYITGASDWPLIIRDNFGTAAESNVLVAQGPLALRSFSIPHFASGDQYSTELTIVNTGSLHTADISLTPLDNNGTPLVSTANVQIQPGSQLITTVANLFPALEPGLMTGSIKVDVRPSNLGPFVAIPTLSGSIRFSNVDGSASATLPLVVSPAKKFVYSHTAQTQDWFTGVAVQNPNTTAATFTLDVFRHDGTLVGSYSSQLRPGERFAKLLYELVPSSAGKGGGYIKISSTANLTSFALFGTNDLKSLSAIPPQVIP